MVPPSASIARRPSLCIQQHTPNESQGKGQDQFRAEVAVEESTADGRDTIRDGGSDGDVEGGGEGGGASWGGRSGTESENPIPDELLSQALADGFAEAMDPESFDEWRLEPPSSLELSSSTNSSVTSEARRVTDGASLAAEHERRRTSIGGWPWAAFVTPFSTAMAPAPRAGSADIDSECIAAGLPPIGAIAAARVERVICAAPKAEHNDPEQLAAGSTTSAHLAAWFRRASCAAPGDEER